ncbi:TPA: hypothetical protein ACYSE6_006596 [Pseudomonas aeruginosa]
MSERQIRAGLNTPLSKLGELPDELFLACLLSVPSRLQDALVSKWSAQLNTKKHHRH